MSFACRITKAKIQTLTNNVSYLLLFHDNNGYANAPKFYVYTYITCLVSVKPGCSQRIPTSLVWLLAQCMVLLGTLHRHLFFFLFAQCVVLMSFRGPQEATLNSCTEHRTSSTQALTCTVHWQLLVKEKQACLAWSAFVRCLVTCPLRSSSCPLGWYIWHTLAQTHTHTHK